MKNKTHIIATIGPKSFEKDILKNMFDNGMTIARFNFSHNIHEWHTDLYNNIKSVAPQTLLLQDLCGPKIRVFIEESIDAQIDDIVLLSEKDTREKATDISFNTEGIVSLLTVGTFVLIYDGTIKLEIISSGKNRIKAKVLRSGKIKNNKGVNIPGVTLPVQAITEKDKRDLVWGLDHTVDYVALSFVKTAKDVEGLREIINAHTATKKPLIISKIETVEAIKNIESIIKASDAIMVARGDLGVEFESYKVPVLQKKIINLCIQHDIPVIVATQMMESVRDSLVSTRAEVSDVFNAVVDGAQGVMLSAESATGIDPANAVKLMREVTNEAERYLENL